MKRSKNEDGGEAVDEVVDDPLGVFSTLSHELRNPLNSIIGFVSILRKTKMTPEQEEMMEHVHNSSELLLSLLNDILDVRKYARGDFDLESVKVSLDDIIDNVIGAQSHTARSKRVSIYQHVDKNTPLKITGDPTRLTQILTNLTSNSIKFTSEGYVKIGAGLYPRFENAQSKIYQNKRIIGDEFRSISGITLEVEDTGIGMCKEVADKLFSEFQQGGLDTARKFGGTGLGLSIVKNLVEKMKGNIVLESTLGEGSRISVILPLTTPVSMSSEITNTDAEIGKRKNVAFLRDNANDVAVNYLESVLNRSGYNLISVSSVDSISKDCQFLCVRWRSEEDNLWRRDEISRWISGNISRKVYLIMSAFEENDVIKKEIKFVENFLGTKSRRLSFGRLPLNRRSVWRFTGEHAKKSEKNGKYPGLRVLVVEDSLPNQLMIKRMLKILGINDVDCVNNGKECIDILEEKSYDIIFMDYHMPIMNGMETAQKIRQDLGEKIVIILMSGSIENAMLGKIKICGTPFDYDLPKPFNLSSITNIIQLFFGSKKVD